MIDVFQDRLGNYVKKGDLILVAHGSALFETKFIGVTDHGLYVERYIEWTKWMYKRNKDTGLSERFPNNKPLRKYKYTGFIKINKNND